MPTIGVAVAIPEPWATQLQEYRTSVGDEMAAMIPTHITLVPPTDVGADDIDAIVEHLESVAGRVGGFGVHLRGTGTFRPVSPVVFVSLADGISQFEQLADVVRRGPLERELPFPYHPHVTIAHHVEDHQLNRAFEELAGFEAKFDVAEFQLYEHDAALGWRPTRYFALQPGD